MPLPQIHQRVADPGSVGRPRARPAGAILKARRTPSDEPLDPLVGGLAGDAVLGAAVQSPSGPPQMIPDQEGPLMHGRRFPPGHGAPPSVPQYRQSVTRVPGLKCYLCPRTVPAIA